MVFVKSPTNSENADSQERRGGFYLPSRGTNSFVDNIVV